MKEEIMKCIVETTGSFMLLNTTMEAIPSQRPCVTTMNTFVNIAINEKKLKVLARNLPRKASDTEFLEGYIALEKDGKQAAAAYCAEFGLTIDGEPLDDVEVETETQKEEKEEKEDADTEPATEDSKESTTVDVADEAKEIKAEKPKGKQGKKSKKG